MNDTLLRVYTSGEQALPAVPNHKHRLWEVDCCPLDIQLIFRTIPGWVSIPVPEAEGGYLSTKPRRGCLCWICDHQANYVNVFPTGIPSTAPKSRSSHCMSSEAQLIAAGNHLFPCWSGVSSVLFTLCWYSRSGVHRPCATTSACILSVSEKEKRTD